MFVMIYICVPNVGWVFKLNTLVCSIFDLGLNFLHYSLISARFNNDPHFLH